MIDFRQGRWQDVLADVERCDVLLTDPPFSDRTAKGFRGTRREGDVDHFRTGIDYGSIDEADVHEATSRWSAIAQEWVLIFCDHIAFRWWEEAWTAVGWQTFAPVGWVKRGAIPRFAGDGPCSALEYLFVARSAGWPALRGSRPGFYDVAAARHGHGGGQRLGTKDGKGLRAIIADYTRPGALIVDPFGGTATVGAAAKATGRNYIGSEVDHETYTIGLERLANTQETPDWSWPDRWKDKDVKQGGLAL